MTARSDRKFRQLKTDDEVLRDGPGRPPHVPTDQQRVTVKAMSAYGIPQDQIARVIGIHDESLRRHYRDELDLGVIEANAQIAKTLFQQAVGGNIAAAIWWTKSRMGWKERQEVELSGNVTVAVALSAATERLKKLGDGVQGKGSECTQLNGSECIAINGSECGPDCSDS